MSSRKATENFCFVHTTQYIYEEDNKSALERLGRQATFKFQVLWIVRDGKGLIIFHTRDMLVKCVYYVNQVILSHILTWNFMLDCQFVTHSGGVEQEYLLHIHFWPHQCSTSNS